MPIGPDLVLGVHRGSPADAHFVVTVASRP
jgi:hypothetical protein